MVRILVVDDSPMEQKLSARLLEKRPEWLLSFASSGQEALALMARQSPDVVLSDLKLPGMDGLELLREIRERFSQVPVVILTSPGTEEIAMDALRSGAASYVAKKTRADQFIAVLEMVLAANKRQRNHHQLMESLTLKQIEFVVPNDRRLIPALINYLQESCLRIGVFGEQERTRVGVALEEALLNAARSWESGSQFGTAAAKRWGL